MKIHKTDLNDCLIIEPDVFEDERGFFQETYHDEKYSFLGYKFIQDNHSFSYKGVLRGLHFQKINPQGKLVRVTRGEIFDVAIDLRPSSKTFKRWYSVKLSSENKKQFWIPPGFAHGFLTLSDVADLQYKCTAFYDPNDEGCIIWNDPELSIKWPIKMPLVSKKDRLGKKLSEIVI